VTPAHGQPTPSTPVPRGPVARRILTAALSVAIGVAGAGCGSTETPPGRTPTTASPPRTPADSRNATATSQSPQDDRMGIHITIGEQRFQATLVDSAATRDLVAQLPVTIDMTDHGGVEKTGPLPSPLSLDGQPDAADPDVGDVGYYAPGNDLVLYYGDQSSYAGIVVLGRLDGNAAERISAMTGPVTATVQASGD
jgi:hypothetical protein